MVLKTKILFIFILFVNFNFAQNNDSAKVILDKYIYSDYTFSKIKIDTSLTDFQLYNPVYNDYYKNISLGNIGLPILDINDVNNFKTNEFIFASSLKNYVFNVNDVRLYKTNRRFTNVTFYNNGSKSKAENVVKIFHSQNLNPYLNISFKYNLINSLGYYKYQASKDNMLNFTAYYDKNRITSFFIVNYNALSYQNNGGVVNDSSIFNTDSYQTELIDVNLSSSVSTYKNINLNFVARYNFGNKKDTVISDSSTVFTINRKSFIEYNFKLDKNKYLYNDIFSPFYINCFYSDSASSDSLTSFYLANSLIVSNFNNDSQKFAYALGVNFDLNKYYITNLSSLQSDAYINALIRYKLKKTVFSLKTKYFIDGFKQGDYNTKFIFNINKFYLGFENYLQTPNYFISRLFTNTFLWHNEFDKIFNLNIFSRYVFDKDLYFGFKVSSISNYIYLNSVSYPTQLSDNFVYLKFEVFKKFGFKKFKFITKNNLQYLPDNLDFSLPLFNTYNSVFYQTFLVKDVLKIQTGIDFFYNTKFKGYNYMPSLSMYYVSDSDIGNYPYINAFVNLKLKRVNFTFKVIHLNQNLFGGKYVSVPNYPLMERGIRFGISWNFYD